MGSPNDEFRHNLMAHIAARGEYWRLIFTTPCYRVKIEQGGKDSFKLVGYERKLSYVGTEISHLIGYITPGESSARGCIQRVVALMEGFTWRNQVDLSTLDL